MDLVFLEPYTSIFAYLAKFLPEEDRSQHPANWIMERSISEIDSFCLLLEHAAGSFLGLYGEIEMGTVEELLN